MQMRKSKAVFSWMFTFHSNHEVAIKWSKNAVHPKFPGLSSTVGALRGIIPEQIRRHHKSAWLVQEDHLAATSKTQDGSSKIFASNLTLWEESGILCAGRECVVRMCISDLC